jgi:hypothetical protein
MTTLFSSVGFSLRHQSLRSANQNVPVTSRCRSFRGASLQPGSFAPVFDFAGSAPIEPPL